MFDSPLKKAMAVTIGACALSMVLLMIKVVGAPIPWVVVWLPAGIVLAVWVSLYTIIAILAMCLFILGDE